MQDYKEPLNLNESYSFEVIVRDNFTNFAGKLKLSPDGCTLKIMGERQFISGIHDIETLECFSFRNHFLLSDIRFKTARTTSLELPDPNNRGFFFEIEFNIGFVIKSSNSTPLKNETVFSGFSIEAEMIKNWTGITNKQKNLLLSNNGSVLSGNEDNDFKLFDIPLENMGYLYLAYNMNLHTSVDSMSSGVKLTPQLGMHFSESRNINDLLKEIRKIYTLLAFFWGGDFKINHLKVVLPRIRGSYISAYYDTIHENNKNVSPVFPLGFDVINSNIVNSYEGLPLGLFQNYYGLEAGKIEYFKKYLRYKRMKSNEEKFLGYFRILERLVHTTSTYVDEDKLTELLNKSRKYLSRKLNSRSDDIRKLCKVVIRSNRGKYVTHDCITRFFDEIPIEIRKSMVFDRTHIQGISTLRNNMTHANEYEIKDSELFRYTKFIHQILVIALVNKLLDVSLDVLIPLANQFESLKI